MSFVGQGGCGPAARWWRRLGAVLKEAKDAEILSSLTIDVKDKLYDYRYAEQDSAALIATGW